MKLWYQKPAERWCEALPVGNGRLGGMIFGNPANEMIQINEDSVWSGKKLDRINPDALKNLPKIRQMIRNGEIEEAQKLALFAFSGTPNSQRAYQTAGECYINMHEIKDVTEYRRELDIETAISSVTFTSGGVSYQREVFVSAVAGCMVIRMSTLGKKPFSFNCHLGRNHNFTDEVNKENDNTVFFHIDGPDDGISACAALMVDVPEKGKTEHTKVQTLGEHIVAESVTECCLYLDVETSFRYKDFSGMARKRCRDAAKKGWSLLKKEHLEDYQKLYSRMQLHYGRSQEEKEQIPTDLRLKAVQNGAEDMGLLELYFQFGRYLLISSSREGSLPSTLQGIWNNSLTPSWDSKYTININTEMNYWMAETANLSECHLPFFEHLARVCENGKETARRMYNCRGSVCHHNTDIYADTAPQDHCVTATLWPMGEAWLATHIWEHYQFTQDKEFLEKYFDVLEQNVLFFYDFLIEGKDGKLVTSPSLSPENTYQMADGTRGALCESPTMDIEILTDLFQGYIKACQVLGKDEARTKHANDVMNRFPALKIGKYGQLQEWMEDYDEPEPGHRHISHLYGVYPGGVISKKKTPELLEAARISLERRLANGGGHTGWSRAWIIGMWAAFGDGAKAYENLHEILCMGTFPNLMDNHPIGADDYVFQIDGNFGAAAAMIEMLVKSRANYLELLPAITNETDCGSLYSVRARGGVEVSMTWENGRVRWLKIVPDRVSEEIYPIDLCVNNRNETVLLKRGICYEKYYE